MLPRFPVSSHACTSDPISFIDFARPAAPSSQQKLLPSYKQLSSRLRQLPPLQQLHHVTSLSEKLQQAQLAELYRQLLRYTADCCRRAAGPGDCSTATGGQVALRSADALVPLLYDLTQKLGDVACEAWRAWLGDCWRRRQRRRRSYPGLGVLLPLRLCGQLFPSSDRRHPVTMPAMLLLTQMLAECRVGSRRELSAGLLAASLLMEVSTGGLFVPGFAAAGPDTDALVWGYGHR